MTEIDIESRGTQLAEEAVEAIKAHLQSTEQLDDPLDGCWVQLPILASSDGRYFILVLRTPSPEHTTRFVHRSLVKALSRHLSCRIAAIAHKAGAIYVVDYQRSAEKELQLATQAA